MRRLGRLDARESEIVGLRFGLGDGMPLTLKEDGKRLGCTREWVRKIEIRALLKLGDGAVLGVSAGPGLAVDGRSVARTARPRTRACRPA